MGMERVRDWLEPLQQRRTQLSCEQFVRQFPHPFLLRALHLDEPPPSGFTTKLARSPTLANAASLREQGLELVHQVGQHPERFVLHPIVKSSTNPWRDRIMVGRTDNNDIVLRFDSVSKSHGYFENRNGIWLLTDCHSANGIRVGGKRLAPGESHELPQVALICFGAVACELLDSATLYSAL
jgi:hypothetical protein